MDPIPTVVVLILINNQLLTVKHTQNANHLTGTYGLPGGRVELNETLIDAAIRELEEETGFVANKESMKELPKEYTAQIKRKNGETKLFSMKIFTCKEYSGHLKESEDTIPEWIPLSDIDKYTFVGNEKEAIKESLKYI
jgi:8-oxo-dGTP pyrophosphatase MutT (NUDIX family)